MSPEEGLTAEEREIWDIIRCEVVAEMAMWNRIRARLDEIVEREARKDFPITETDEE